VEPLVEALPRAEVTILDGVLPWLEDPPALERVAHDFVREIGGTVDDASPDAPCPRGREDPTGRSHR
jgi:hypothetical protein